MNNYLEEVKNQYENYPYPYRNPEDEKNGLIRSIGCDINEIKNNCFNGKLDLDNFSALVAGGGTGDATIHLAEQLKDTKARVVHLDISETSMNIAKERAKIRGLNNITWILDSILNLPTMDISKFDFINCSGVLHHLESPLLGAKALNSVLKDDGSMIIMLYGKYPRVVVYQMQELMKIVNKNELNMQTKVDNTKTMINCLSEDNLFVRSNSIYLDVIQGKNRDIEVYDLFLHSQDRAYNVLEIYELFSEIGLNHINFFRKSSYDVNKFVKDKNLLKEIDKLSKSEKEAIAENMNGNIDRHIFYVSKKDNSISFQDLSFVPTFYTKHLKGINLYLYINKNPQQKDLLITFDTSEGKVDIVIPIKKYTKEIFKYLDGINSLEEIFTLIKQNFRKKVKEKDLLKVFKEIYKIFNFDNSFLILKEKEII